MPDYEQAVFISYAWGGERKEIVNQIDEALQQRGIKIIRDKRDLGYKGSISEFMERIGRGNSLATPSLTSGGIAMPMPDVQNRYPHSLPSPQSCARV